jgi:hypothetical protein
MPDVLSADTQFGRETLPRARAFEVSAAYRAAMVALGFIPVLHLIATLLPLVLALNGRITPTAAWLSPMLLYIVPPLVVRLATTWTPLPAGVVNPGSAAFLQWWFSAQWQVVFARFPALEELLRMVPGLYSMWLRLWGARVGSVVYWSPGVVIFDRSLVRIGSRVIVGTGARFIPHTLAPVGRSDAKLYLAPITVGDDVLVGASSQLLPGCEVAAGEITPPFRTIHHFSRFANGRRERLRSDLARSHDPKTYSR